MKFSQTLTDKKKELASKSRTARLWIMYLDYVSIMKKYIVAERTSNWALHLETTKEMLNLFAATGHINYAKSARLYVQQMIELQQKHPWLKQKFEEGFHAVRRSTRYWAGLWSDLVIEQTMMRSIKTRGGLTRGRGMSEDVRHLWVLSMSDTTLIHQAMTEATGLAIKSSEQHVEMGITRRSRDHRDCQKFLEWLQQRNPFLYKDNCLHSLSLGMISDERDAVNCDQAEKVGQAIQDKLDGISILASKIKRKDQVSSMMTLQNNTKKWSLITRFCCSRDW
jgi:regulator of replication initiation timing